MNDERIVALPTEPLASRPTGAGGGPVDNPTRCVQTLTVTD